MGAVGTVTTATVRPGAICALGDRSCRAGTTQATVDVSVQAVFAGAGGVAGALSNLTLSFLPWGRVVVDASPPGVAGEFVTTSDASCNGNVIALTAGPSTGFQVAWRSVRDLDTMFVGESWTVTFGISSTGPPFRLGPRGRVHRGNLRCLRQRGGPGGVQQPRPRPARPRPA